MNNEKNFNEEAIENYKKRQQKEDEVRENSIALKIYNGIRTLCFSVVLAGSLYGAYGVAKMTPEEKDEYLKTFSVYEDEEQVEFIEKDEEEQDEIEMTTPDGRIAKVKIR